MELKWKSCLRAGVTVMLLFLLIHYWVAFTNIVAAAVGAATPLLLGCAIAYIVNILMSFLERCLENRIKKPVFQKLRRPACILLAFIGVVCIIVCIVQMIVPELLNCLKILLEQLPEALQSAMLWLENNLNISTLFEGENSLLQINDADWRESLTKIADLLLNGFSGAMGIFTSVVSSVFSTVVTLLVALIFSIYLLAGKETIGRQFKLLLTKYLPKKLTDKVFFVLHTLNNSFHSFIVGQCTEAVILGLLCMVGMLLLRIPYAAMIGCLIGFTALIPVAGAYIGAVAGMFMIFTVSPVKAAVFLVFLVVLQQLEGNLIYPRVVGSSIGLPGVWVLAAVTIGGGMLGIGGMLLGVPLAATIYQILKADIFLSNIV